MKDAINLSLKDNPELAELFQGASPSQHKKFVVDMEIIDIIPGEEVNGSIKSVEPMGMEEAEPAESEAPTEGIGASVMGAMRKK